VAHPNLAPSTPFLIFPTGSPSFAWRIVAIETNRTISRHRNLALAVEKAEQLNRRSLEILSLVPAMPDPEYAGYVPYAVRETLGGCNSWYEFPLGHANECSRPATVTDVETGCGFCPRCYREVCL
jgi:hypothetical protein